MDLSLLQKVNELKEQGRSAEEIKQELHVQGIAPDTINEALTEVGMSVSNNQANTSVASAPLQEHHEKIIQPSPGFDPNAR